jgi:hypothetical protein
MKKTGTSGPTSRYSANGNLVIVEIRGGSVVEVYANDPGIAAVIVDWDELNEFAETDRKANLWGRCATLDKMPEETRAALEGIVDVEGLKEPFVVGP